MKNRTRYLDVKRSMAAYLNLLLEKCVHLKYDMDIKCCKEVSPTGTPLNKRAHMRFSRDILAVTSPHDEVAWG